MNEEKKSYYIFRPDTVKACLFVVHGMEEHYARYASFAKAMNEQGYACILFDLPGHGKDCPKEDLGYFGKEGWHNLIDAASKMNEIAHREFPNVPIIYFGHSMGTIIGRTFLQKHDHEINAMILSGAPNYNPACSVGRVIASIICKTQGEKERSKFLTQLSTGSFNKYINNPKTEVDWLSYNENNVKAYIEDELCGVPFTNRGYHSLFSGMSLMHDTKQYQVKNKDLPILFLAGHDDPCIGGEKGFSDSMKFIYDLGYHDMESKLYAHKRHEILNEDHPEEIIDDIVTWLSKKL